MLHRPPVLRRSGEEEGGQVHIIDPFELGVGLGTASKAVLGPKSQEVPVSTRLSMAQMVWWATSRAKSPASR